MKSNLSLLRHLAALWRADFLSAKDLVRRACLITVVFLVVQSLGLRDFTSVLSGTPGNQLSWRMSGFLGLLYIVAYLGFVLLVPILLLAAAILKTWGSLSKQLLEAKTNTAHASVPRDYERSREPASPNPVADSAVYYGPLS